MKKIILPRKLKVALEKRQAARRGTRKTVYLGRPDGVIRTTRTSFVYVTDALGNTQEVFNRVIPTNKYGFGLPVWIVRAPGGYWQIEGVKDVYDDPVDPGIMEHAAEHSAYGHDPNWIWSDAFMPWLVMPVGKTVKIYRMAYYTGSGWLDGSVEIVDLTSHIPASGALYVLMEIASDGTTVVTDGSPAASREALTKDDIPALTAGRKPLCAVRLYAGMSLIQKNAINKDFYDLRFAQIFGSGGGGGIPGGADTQIQFNNAGAFGGSSDMVWDATGKLINIDGTEIGKYGYYAGGVAGQPSFDVGDNVIQITMQTGAQFRVGDETDVETINLRNHQVDYFAFLDTALLTVANRIYQFPDKAGTFAMTSDIGTPPPVTDVENDFQVGGVGATIGTWVKKTLAETITILRTSLDSVYAALAGLSTQVFSVAAATAIAHAVRADQIQLNSLGAYTTGGTSTAFTFATLATPIALTTGEKWTVTFNATAGASPTLNRDTKGAKALKYYDSAGAKQACGATTIISGMISDVIYDGTDYVVISPAPTAAVSGAVPTARTLTGTAPIAIEGDNSAHDLSANRTVSIIPATTSVPGSMSAADKTKLDGITAGATQVVAETNAAELFRVAASPGGVCDFAGLINTVSTVTVVYKTPTGTEAAMVPFATSNLAKMRLYNTTRGNYALISNCVVATKTITLTANAPANWAANDVLTIQSQTLTFGGTGLYWADLEITSGPTGKTALFIDMVIASATVGNLMALHPYESYGASKSTNVIAQVANTSIGVMKLIKITSNVFCVCWTGTPSTLVLREAGYIT